MLFVSSFNCRKLKSLDLENNFAGEGYLMGVKPHKDDDSIKYFAAAVETNTSLTYLNLS